MTRKLKIIAASWILAFIFFLSFHKIYCMEVSLVKENQSPISQTFLKSEWKVFDTLNQEISPLKSSYQKADFFLLPSILSSSIINAPIKSILLSTLFILPHVNAVNKMPVSDLSITSSDLTMVFSTMAVFVTASILYCCCSGEHNKEKREIFLKDISDARKAWGHNSEG